MFAEIALAIPGLKPLTYRIPAGESVEKGMRVSVPLGRRVLTGVVVDITDRLPREIRNLKSIIKILDKEPALTGELLVLGRWMAEYYYCSWGEALGAMLPAAYKPVGRVARQPGRESPSGPTEHPLVLNTHQRAARKRIGE
ncbi:hypothetical protein KAR10_03055, partial [bacterium]|nr:hypothetical protein [bacterium]